MSKRPRDEDDSTLEKYLEAGRDLETGQLVCRMPPCYNKPKIFGDYPSYELHMINFHTHICQKCKKRFPSQIILDIHIEENHDPFFALKRERGEKVYRCLNFSNTNGCRKLCSDRKKRRLHMIDKHGYPKAFNFGIIDHGMK